MKEEKKDLLSVRTMTSEDTGRIAELEQLCFSVPWSKKLLEDSANNPFDRGFVLESDGEIQAYAILSIVAGDGEIQRIAVHPDSRRRGLASKLMEAMRAYAIDHGAEGIFLEVRESNEAARNLYKAWGFKVEGIRKGYYKDPKEDAVLMSLHRF